MDQIELFNRLLYLKTFTVYKQMILNWIISIW